MVASAHVRDAEYRDPRLVEVYDVECPWGPDDDFYLAWVDATPGARVLDLGCGTGRLALALSARGHAVTGVDPAEASVRAARRKPRSESVRWRVGSAESLPEASFDVALMTSHVAQFFLSDDEWACVLERIARSLVASGRLAFNAYDPRARPWQRWTPAQSRRSVPWRRSTVALWTEVQHVRDEVVTYCRHYELPGGERLRSDSSLRFRGRRHLERSLVNAGFRVESVYGGWNGEAVGAGVGEMVFLARRAAR